jgi:drug/metabolite transporter (DMT)-like permease
VAVRLVAAAALLGLVLAVRPQSWAPLRKRWHHLALAGVLVNGITLSAFHVGMVTENVAVMALMQTLSPMLIAVLAGPLLGERLGPTQWLGLVLGATGVIIGADVTQTGRKPIGKDERRIVARSSVSSSDRGGM